MEQEYFGKKFFGSKLNTALLLILIILMIFALRIMLKDKETYLPILEEQDDEHRSQADLSEVFFKDKKIMSFLRNLITEHPYADLKKCSLGGDNFLFAIYRDARTADGNTIFFTPEGVEVEKCGGYGIEPISESSLCKTLLPKCVGIYYNGYDESEHFDRFNLSK